jgi:hypothetical protein
VDAGGAALLKCRHYVSALLIVILLVSSEADDTALAILRSSGSILLNGSEAPSGSAVFLGDSVENQGKTIAALTLNGTRVDVNSETLLRLENDGIRLDHGSVLVSTSRGFHVRVGCIFVTPVVTGSTLYEVTDRDGSVTVAARTKDVNIDSRSADLRQAKKSPGSPRVLVREGEQKSRGEKCGAANPQSASKAAAEGILNSPYALWSAFGVGAAIVCWSLCRNDDPPSPSTPR